MRIKHNGTFYHRIKLAHSTASEYFISRENKIIRRKYGVIYEVNPKLTKGVKYLETTVEGTYNPLTKLSSRKVKTYNQVYASVFYRGKKYFAIMEIDGIPTLLSKKQYAEITAPRLAKFSGTRHDSNSKVKSVDLQKIKELKDNGHTLPQIAKLYSCSPTSVSRALKSLN